MKLVRSPLRRLLRRLGVDLVRHRPFEDEVIRFARACEDRGVRTLLDVGGFDGAFAQAVRQTGFTGRIVSFEPLPHRHAQLSALAKHDADWDIAPAVALGSQAGTAPLHVSGTDGSSSLLPLLDRHATAAAGSQAHGTLEIIIETLDAVVARMGLSGPFGLKLDVNGGEAAVLRGGLQTLAQTPVLFTQASLTPLFEGAMPFEDYNAWLKAMGYRVFSLEPYTIDPHSLEMLQLTMILVRGPDAPLA